MEEGGSVQLGKHLAREKALHIRTQLLDIGLLVKLVPSFTLQEVAETSQENTIQKNQCPVCDLPWGEHEPQLCPSCKFSPRMATPDSIARQRIAWEERKLIEAENKRLKDKSRQQMQEEEETAIRKRIRKELEKEMQEQFSHQSLWHGRKGLLVRSGVFAGLILVFASGFWFGQFATPQTATTEAEQKITAPTIDLDALPTIDGKADSLEMLLEQQGKMSQTVLLLDTPLIDETLIDNDTKQNATEENHLLNPIASKSKADQLLSSDHFTLPKYAHHQLISDYLSLLLSIQKIQRADEVYQRALNQQKTLQLSDDNVHLMQLSLLAHILDNAEPADAQTQFNQIATVIDRLPEKTTQIRAWAEVAHILSHQSTWSDQAFARAEALNQSPADADIITISRARLAFEHMKQAGKIDHWQKAEQQAQNISQIANTAQSSSAIFITQLLRYQASVLQGDASALADSQQRTLATIPLLKYSEREKLIPFWREQAEGLSAPFNQELANLFQAALNEDGMMDEQTLQLWRACSVANQEACVKNLSDRLNESMKTATQDTFVNRLYFYTLLDSIKPAYRNQKYASAEVWTRILFDVLFRR